MHDVPKDTHAVLGLNRTQLSQVQHNLRRRRRENYKLSPCNAYVHRPRPPIYIMQRRHNTARLADLSRRRSGLCISVYFFQRLGSDKAVTPTRCAIPSPPHSPRLWLVLSRESRGMLARGRRKIKPQGDRSCSVFPPVETQLSSTKEIIKTNSALGQHNAIDVCTIFDVVRAENYAAYTLPPLRGSVVLYYFQLHYTGDTVTQLSYAHTSSYTLCNMVLHAVARPRFYYVTYI